MKPKRVISLLPAATEIVCAFGASELLVGRSHECDFPPDVKKLPACTASKLNETGGAEINRQVDELAKKGESLYRLDEKLMQELRPDLIITQGQCEVCAVSLREVEAMVGRWAPHHPEILSLAPTRMAELWNDMRRVAVALGLEEHGKEVIRALKNRVVGIIEKTCVLTKKPSVACIEWIEPLMAAGNWVPEMVELAGGRNLIGQAGKHSAWTDWAALRKADPDIIVMMPCGFDLERTRAETSVLARHPDWPKLSAVKQGRVYLADGNQYFNRPGPRLVDSLEILAEMMHPEMFAFERGGWEKFSGSRT